MKRAAQIESWNRCGNEHPIRNRPNVEVREELSGEGVRGDEEVAGGDGV
jgi:hypothetical protein